jgi:predicted glycosyltransferase
MKIVVDINHPAHVHYFKHFIWEMQKRGHEILITASEKEISYKLLDAYGFSYIKLGNYGKSIPEKIFNLPLLDFRMYRAVKRFSPDLFLGFGSIRAAHVSRILKKPCIALDDTEHAVWEHRLYVPFTDVIITPACFQKDFGKKHIRYQGYTELAYLHPDYFTPDPAVLEEIGINEGDPIVIIRFVSWHAGHDFRQKGINNKHLLVKELAEKARVLISSEEQLDKTFESYHIRIPPEKLHDLLYFATLYIGEGATTASECAVLGTHAIYVNSLRVGTIHEEDEKYHLVSDFSHGDCTDQQVIEKAKTLLSDVFLRQKGKMKRSALLGDSIDVTGFLIWFIENYPESIKIWRVNPEYQKKFKCS